MKGLSVMIKILIAVLISFLPSSLFAESSVNNSDYALLIGVGDYIHAKIGDLQGPPYDVMALERLLKSSFGFPPNNIISLTDAKATRANILNALRNLNHITKPGDFIFFYFSGHGTSYHDKSFKDMNIEANSGALLQADFDPDKTRDEMKEKLIIGKRDIRPILEEMEKERRILAVFDACFSGNTIRSVRRNYKARYYPLPRSEDDFVLEVEGLTDEEDEVAAYGTDTIKKTPYPYKNVVYISASSEFQVAEDISMGKIRTADGKPHGAMTNALLLALGGEGDMNNDSKLTYNEIYQYVKHKTTEDFSQTPQVLYAKNKKSMLDQPVFHNVSPATPDVPVKPDVHLKVKPEGTEREIEWKKAGIRGVEMTDKNYDILVTKSQGAYRLYLASGVMLTEIPQANPDHVVKRIRHQVLLRELIRFSIPRQQFNVFLDTMDRKGVWREGELAGFTVRSEAECHILLIGIDTGAMISVIYPYSKEESEAVVKANQELRFPELAKVEGPDFGVEYIKVFAFRKRPATLNRLMGETFSPDARPFSELMKMLREAGNDLAQMTLQFNTCAKNDLVRKR